MDCRTDKSCKFKRKLGFKLYDVINKKQQAILRAIKDAFEGENIHTEYSVLGFRVDLYFHEYKFAIEVDEFKQTMMQKYQTLKRKLLIMIMINTLLLTTEFNKLTTENFAARFAQAI